MTFDSGIDSSNVCVLNPETSLIRFIIRLWLGSESDFHVAFNGGYQDSAGILTEDGTFLLTVVGEKLFYTFSQSKDPLLWVL